MFWINSKIVSLSLAQLKMPALTNSKHWLILKTPLPPMACTQRRQWVIRGA
nr:MAG TPA: hypothetical protein [Caudoviricetes sp.]